MMVQIYEIKYTIMGRDYESPSKSHIEFYECEDKDHAENLLRESLTKKGIIDSLDIIVSITEKKLNE